MIGSGHRDSLTQRFGYDYGVHRWDGSTWNKLVDGGDSKKNEDYLIWDVPVRAMADGWVFSCNRNVDDNTPPTRGEEGGNSVVVVHAPEELVLYAHFKKGTVRSDVCPRSGSGFRPNAIRVKAGQILGHAGNSGRSSGPHLHVHVVTNADDDGQGRPARVPQHPRAEAQGRTGRAPRRARSRARLRRSRRRRAARGSSSSRSTARASARSRATACRTRALKTSSGESAASGYGSAGSPASTPEGRRT